MTCTCACVASSACLQAIERGCQFVLLGSAPDPKVQAEFDELANELGHGHERVRLGVQEPGCVFLLKNSLCWHGRSLFVCLHSPACAMQHAAIDRLLAAVRDSDALLILCAPRPLCSLLRCMQDAGFVFGYDEPLSHMIYAAADIILVPSMFEPCGLTQVCLSVNTCDTRGTAREAAVQTGARVRLWCVLQHSTAGLIHAHAVPTKMQTAACLSCRAGSVGSSPGMGCMGRGGVCADPRAGMCVCPADDCHALRCCAGRAPHGRPEGHGL